MSNNWVINEKVDLQKGISGYTVWPHALLIVGDKNAHKWNVTIMDGGSAADIRGNVTAYFTRSDGDSVVVNGTLDGNISSVTFAPECYAYEGDLKAIMRVSDGDSIVTVSAMLFRVANAVTGSVIDPGDVIPSLDDLLAQIAAMESAANKANDAADNANNAANRVDESINNANTAADYANSAAESASKAANDANKATDAANAAAKKAEDSTKNKLYDSTGNNTDGAMTQKAVTDAIDGIEIGGTNLLSNTSKEWKSASVTRYFGVVRNVTIAELGLNVGDYISYSLDIQTNSGKKLRARIRFKNDTTQLNDAHGTQVIENGFGHTHVTAVIPENCDNIELSIDANLTSSVFTSSTIENYKCVKLERGNKPTDWSPAPEDIQEDIGIFSLGPGGVPYGKELTESWESLTARVKQGNFSGIRIGDYKTIQLTTGDTVIMEVAGIDQYYKCSDTSIGHHIDFISRDTLKGNRMMNNDANNNGTENEHNPWRASDLFIEMNNTVFNTLPADLQSCIIEKRAYIESRYSSTGKINDDNAAAWNNMGKLWLPTEVEVFGIPNWSDVGYGTCGGGCNLQYPIFIGGTKHIVKMAGNGSTTRSNWWMASAGRGSSTYFCCVGTGSEAIFRSSSHNTVSAPICFRIG